MEWFMGEQMMNFGYDLGMWFQWNGWYQNGMVLVWGEILYSWIGKNEMVWIQHGIQMRMDG